MALIFHSSHFLPALVIQIIVTAACVSQFLHWRSKCSWLFCRMVWMTNDVVSGGNLSSLYLINCNSREDLSLGRMHSLNNVEMGLLFIRKHTDVISSKGHFKLLPRPKMYAITELFYHVKLSCKQDIFRVSWCQSFFRLKLIYIVTTRL